MASRLGEAFITISARLDKLTSDLAQARAETNAAITSMQVRADSLDFGRASSGLSAIGTAALAAGVALGALTVAAGMIGTKFNETVESSTVGIAALLSAQGKFRDAQGQELTGRDKINAALGYSSDLVKQLQVDNLKTTATFEQLLKAFQVTLAPGLGVGFSVDQVRQYTLAMVQAAAAMQVPLDMMAEETRSLLKGTITPRNTLIATALGITNEDIRKYQGNANGLFAFIMAKLDAFKQFGGILGDTFAGRLSNIKDVISMGLGQSSMPFFERLKDSMKEFYDYALQFDSTANKMVINPQLINSVQLLNDALNTTLSLATIIVKTLDAMGKAYNAVKEARAWMSPSAVRPDSNYTPLGMNPKVTGSDVFGTYDLSNEQRLERVRQLMVAIAEQKRIIDQAQEIGWLRTATEDFSQLPAILASVRQNSNIPELQALRTAMAAVGQDTTQIDAFLRSLNQVTGASGYARDGMDSATIAMRNLGYQASNAIPAFDEFKKKLQEIAGINLDSIGRSLDQKLVELDAKLKAAQAGAKTPVQNAAAEYAKTMADASRTEKEALIMGTDMFEAAAAAASMRSKAAKVQAGELALNAQNEINKEARKKGGAGPVSYEQIDQQILKFKERMGKMYQELYGLDMDYEATRLEASGQYYAAEEVRMAKKVSDQKAAYAKEVADAEQAYIEMQQKIGGKKGSTPEAQAAIASLAATWEAAKQRASEYGAAVDRNAKQDLAIVKQKQMLQGGIDLAQTNVSYAQLAGSMQEQLRTQLALIEASKQEKLANVNKDIPGLAEAYKRLYDEQARIANLRLNGNFADGLTEGMKEFQRTMPTAFDRGKQAFDMLKSSIDSAAGALADFIVTGKMNFSSFATSIIRDLLKIQIQSMLMQAMGGIGGIFGGLFGSIFGIGSSGINEGALHVPGRAAGGPVSAGMPYLVGEKRPEIFVPDRPGRILPNARIGGASDGGSSQRPINLNVRIENQTGQKLDTEQRPTTQQGDDYIAHVVLKKASRDQNYRSQMKSVLGG